MIMRLLALISITCLIVTLTTGCGWRLRGSLTLPEGLNTVQITSPDRGNRFEERLAQLLTANDVTVTDNRSAAQIVIQLGELEENRRVIATGGNTLASEYELTSELSFSILDGDGNTLIPEETVTSIRSYEFDQNEVVSKAEEERLIQKEMQRELVEQIIRRLRFMDLTGGETSATSNNP